MGNVGESAAQSPDPAPLAVWSSPGQRNVKRKAPLSSKKRKSPKQNVIDWQRATLREMIDRTEIRRFDPTRCYATAHLSAFRIELWTSLYIVVLRMRAVPQTLASDNQKLVGIRSQKDRGLRLGSQNER
jgi:hypothetical protein